tara:strand:- start:3 stop:503 length:501 start_codon:yes stop_codon:yes gene_type:complete
MSNFIEKLLAAHPLNKIDRMLTGRNKMKTEAEKKADLILASKDNDGNLLYPNARKDLLTHYFLSQDMSEQTNIPLSLALGFVKEIGDSQRLPFFNPSSGYFKNSTGFSVDDLGANYAGATNMPLDVAYRKGLFKHTESVPRNNDWTQSSIYGFGQGEYEKVLGKFN